MVESGKKHRKRYEDPILASVNMDMAGFNRFADVYGAPLKLRNRSASGPEHKIVCVEQVSVVDTDKGELVLRIGYTFETKKKRVEVKTYVAVERRLDMVCLTHDINQDRWQLRGSVSDSGKLIKLLESYGIEGGEGGLELKRSRYLLAARDLIEYFGKRRKRYEDD